MDPAWAPEPDRLLLHRRELREAFVACLKERVRDALIATVGDRQRRGTCLEQTTSADLEWERARLLDVLVDRSA